MHPDQVLDLQVDLAARSDNTVFHEFVTNVITSYLTQDVENAITSHARRSGTKALASQMAFSIHQMSKVAYSYLVTSDMVDLAVHAASQLDDSDVFRRDMLPSEAGFIVFEKPLELTDVRGERVLVHHALWGAGADEMLQPLIVVHCFTDRTRESPELLRDRTIKYAQDHGLEWSEEEHQERLRLFAALIGDHHDYLTMQVYQDRQVIGPRQTPVPDGLAKDLRTHGVEPIDPDNLFRVMFAIWRLLGQTITNVTEGQASRFARKRARRARIPDRVTVIDLRRIEHPDGVGGGHVEWSHRWYSRGHWAWRKCSEHHPLAEENPSGGWRARVWVRESIKGPADKPLVITDKVMRLSR